MDLLGTRRQFVSFLAFLHSTTLFVPQIVEVSEATDLSLLVSAG